MNKPRFVWGTICLVLAGLLAVLYFVLPADNLMFMLGDVNMPFVPPIVLGIVGVALLATSARPPQEAPQPPRAVRALDPEKAALNQRLETIGWGLFLIMLGGFMFVPQSVVSRGFWSIGVGVIMLGLNVARYVSHIRMSGFTTVLGIIALLGGVLQLFGMQTLEGAILLIILGAYLVVRPWFDQRQLFGKAEER